MIFFIYKFKNTENSSVVSEASTVVTLEVDSNWKRTKGDFSENCNEYPASYFKLNNLHYSYLFLLQRTLTNQNLTWKILKNSFLSPHTLL